MKSWWKMQEARIDALSLRERGMLFVGTLACFLVLADVVWLSPAQKQNQQAQASVKKQAAELQVLREQLRDSLAAPPGTVTGQMVETELTAAQSRLATVSREVAALSSSVGDSAELARVLVHFLKRYEGLTLERTATPDAAPATDNPAISAAALYGKTFVPPAPPVLPGAGGLVQKGIEMMTGSLGGGGQGAAAGTSSTPSTTAATSRVVRRGIELTVSGSYMDLMRYVQTLEKALPELRWGRMKLSSGKTSSQLTLQLYLVEVLP